MNERNKKHLQTQNEGLANLKTLVEEVHPDSLCDVGSEAMCHIMEHFQIPDDDLFRDDFAFMIYNTHIGVDKTDPTKGINSMGTYYIGNVNNLAHQLAHMMKVKPEIAHIIHHAMHVFHNEE